MVENLEAGHHRIIHPYMHTSLSTLHGCPQGSPFAGIDQRAVGKRCVGDYESMAQASERAGQLCLRLGHLHD